MKIKETKLKGAFEIDLEPHEDHRGFFMRTYDEAIFKEAGLNTKWVQESHSYSKKKGTIRGLHFQLPPNEETKIVRAICGEVFMVFVDLRKDSPTFSKWDSVIITEKNKKMIYIPKGFALGMCTLTENGTILYKIDNYYAPESQCAVKWNDPDIGIDWPADNPILSDKDQKSQSLKEFVTKYGGI